MLDPTCPDITGRVLEALCRVRRRRTRIRPCGAASEYLAQSQEADGSWYGRWGVDYIYGTYLALRGLRAAGESDREALHPARRRMAALHPERRRRLGRELRQLRRTHTFDAATARPRKPPGRCWA